MFYVLFLFVCRNVLSVDEIMVYFGLIYNYLMCELCEFDVVLMYCNFCYVKFCSDCVGKYVIIYNKFNYYEVVGFKYWNCDVIFLVC